MFRQWVRSLVVAVRAVVNGRKTTSTRSSMATNYHFYLSSFSRQSNHGIIRNGTNSNHSHKGGDNSPTSYDNKIHVSEIYGNSMRIDLI